MKNYSERLGGEKKLLPRKKVLVTGAAGYIGNHVVNALIDLDQEVYAADFNFKGVNDKAIKIREPLFSGNKKIFNQCGEPDVCIHLAWRDGFMHNSPVHMGDLSKHIGFLNDMMESGLESLTVMGTMHEIGYWEGKIDENTPCNPMSQYGIAKNALRQSLQLSTQCNGVILHWLRGFYITGDEEHASSVFAKMLLADKRGEKMFPFNSGTNACDFIDVKQLALQIAITSLQDEITGIINVCTGTTETLSARAERFIKEKGLTIKLQYGVYPDRRYDSKCIYGDNTLIKKIMSKYA